MDATNNDPTEEDGAATIEEVATGPSAVAADSVAHEPSVAAPNNPSTAHYPLNPAYFNSPPPQFHAQMPPGPYGYAPGSSGHPYFGGQVLYPQPPPDMSRPEMPPPPKPTTVARAARSTKKKTATNGTSSRFYKEELDYLLDLIEEVLPIGKPQWDKVETMYNQVYEPKGRGRIMENLRKKFHGMCKATPPTGATEMDPQTSRAKEIQELIFDKSESTIFRGDKPDEVEEHPIGYCGIQDDTDEPTETESVASVPKRKPRPERSIGGGPKSARVVRKKDDFISAFMATEKAAAKRERHREKLRSQQMNQFLTAFVTAFTPKNGRGQVTLLSKQNKRRTAVTARTVMMMTQS